jgi:hypothetical protein
MNRKATDILLSIEEMVKKVLGHNRNQDMLNKTLLNRIADLEKKISTGTQLQESQDFQKHQDFPKHSGDAPPRRINQQLPGLKPSVKIKQQKPESNQIVRDPNEEEEEKLEVTSKPVGKRRDARYVSSGNKIKQVPVQQKIMYEDGRSVSMAKIEIFDSETKLVKNTKTNATGKWTNALMPGLYTVKISKKETSTKRAIEAQTEINILNSDEPVQLSPFQLEEI